MLKNIRTIINLLKFYRNVPFYFKFHLVIRYFLCPYLKLESFVPEKSDIVELGCGSGILSNILSMKSENRKLTGFDIDEEKIKIAKMTIGGRNNLQFIHKDITEINYKELGSSIFISADVFYQIDFEKQKEIFSACHDTLPSGGMFILKGMSELPKWKVFIDQFQDIVAQKLFGITKASHFFRFNDEDLEIELSKTGFEVKKVRVDSFMIHPHIAFICTKK